MRQPIQTHHRPRRQLRDEITPGRAGPEAALRPRLERWRLVAVALLQRRRTEARTAIGLTCPKSCPNGCGEVQLDAPLCDRENENRLENVEVFKAVCGAAK